MAAAEKGTPQGRPLSPLPTNILSDDLGGTGASRLKEQRNT